MERPAHQGGSDAPVLGAGHSVCPGQQRVEAGFQGHSERLLSPIRENSDVAEVSGCDRRDPYRGTYIIGLDRWCIARRRLSAQHGAFSSTDEINPALCADAPAGSRRRRLAPSPGNREWIVLLEADS